jgi:dihydroorotate dehydrogenase (fumarate)
MDLSTNYLGLRLKNPLMPGASPLAKNLDTCKILEDNGAAAIVLHSLFEEQIKGEQLGSIYRMEMYADSFAEALSYFPSTQHFPFGPEEYLQYISKLKKTVDVPVIASLNGSTLGGWIDYAKQIEQAGADALELNVYHVSTDPTESGSAVEQRLMEVVRGVKQATAIPVSVKISPFFSSLTNLCCQLDDLKADGIVLFNRFYQPDIDLELLEAVPKLHLSNSSELLLRLRWLAIITPHVHASIAVSGGIHTATDAVKSLMTGARAVQVVSCLLRHGPEFIGTILEGMKAWMQENEYDSVRLMQGSMSLVRCPDPNAFERANYMRILQGWDPSDHSL